MDFLGINSTEFHQKSPRYRVIPFGLEKTVSYGSGTEFGPNAVLKASQEVELFDLEYLSEVYKEYGLETLREETIAPTHEGALAQLAQIVETALQLNRIPVVLGGEHSLTVGAIKPLVDRYPSDLVIVQFDAHCDLRDTYDGTKLSHACAMRRCIEGNNVKLVSIGIRNLAQEEFDFIKTSGAVSVFTSSQAEDNHTELSLLSLVEDKNVYLTFDVDSLDCSIMPATGTPEPGGLSWHCALRLLRKVCCNSKIVGIDLVEHSPLSGFDASDFVSAKLLYKIMSYCHAPPRSTFID